MTRENDITKLPKWAQEYIYALKKKINFWENEVTRSQFVNDRITTDEHVQIYADTTLVVMPVSSNMLSVRVRK